ncbi:heavy metal translocating P-type ATPase [Alteromonas sp. ASW11-36]|uniref:Heavy metal translocating P-type ATPase n=1 Tax=Alteromonas arenosi TaxID=3055817 RepID=A0ABT7SXB2_9ALTE|nr:heavy metal translocating P-type ATPase [Alteromonas sp. ASW11-36]MDM7860831.1 heavy metal translocating P-type ATPase [Alteromonas sp. ASW11-36]
MSQCFHCGLPNTEGHKYPVQIDGETHHMCCPGCHAVSQAIVDNGLADYYKFRTEPASKGDELLDETMVKLSIYDKPEVQEEFVFDNQQHKQVQLTVEGITCAACGWLIEKQMAKVAGVKRIAVNVSTRRALVDFAPEETKLSQILSTFQRIGYRASPFQQDKHEDMFKREQKSFLKKVGLAGIMTMQVMMLMMGLYFDLFGNIEAETRQYFYWISLVLTTPVVLYSGSVFYVSAFKAISAKTVNMDVPVTIAIFGTYIAGIKATFLEVGEVYFESICMFIFFLLLSRALEHRARHKAALYSSNMLQYIPVSASLVQEQEVTTVLAKQLKPGQLVLVKAGETIPVDGRVVEGESEVNEAMLNGEFAPATKAPGNRVFGGTVNLSGTITVKVTRSLKDAMVNQIVRMQETAMATKPQIAQIADKLSRYFVTAVLVISGLTFSYWTWQGNSEAFWITISVLVATCPCALGLATPSALTCAMAKLNNNGVILKRADALEQITQIDTLVLDKTGTLTEGRFSITQQWHAPDIDSAEVMQIAASLEMRSEHPIAAAFSTDKPLQVENYATTIGGGIAGDISGHHYRMGAERFIGTHARTQVTAIDNKALEQASVWLSKDDNIIAIFWLNDTLKAAVDDTLRRIPVVQKVLLSGDTQPNVEAVASSLALNDYLAKQSPQDKLNYVTTQQTAGKHIMMLGDGVNDAPVLAKADISVAVGNATDLAKSSADVVLLNESISALPQLFTLADKTKLKIKQNILWALGYNVLVLPFAVSGVLEPWMAALGMSLSSVIVVMNSTRLLR